MPAGPHVVIGRLILAGHLDAVGQEAEDDADPQQDGEAAEQLAAELDPLGRGWRRRQGVSPVPRQNFGRLGDGETLQETS